MATTQHDADIINEDRRRQADLMQERLARLGVTYRWQTYTGDSSYPVEHILQAGVVTAVGPTYDLAVTELIEKLLRTSPASAETALLADLKQAQVEASAAATDYDLLMALVTFLAKLANSPIIASPEVAQLLRDISISSARGARKREE